MYLSIDNKSKIEMFVALFQLLKNWGSNITLQFEKEQLFIQNMDKSHICLSNITIKKSWFTEYNVTNDSCICVDSNSFAIIINYALKHKKMDILFSGDDDNDTSSPDKIFINLLNNDTNPTSKKDNFDHFFELSLIDNEQDVLSIPDVDYNAEFTIDSKKFSELISELNVFGSNLNIRCSEEIIEMNASGDAGKLKVNIPIDDLNEFAIAEGEELDISYSLNHISKMCLSTKLGSTVEIFISTEYPMSFKYNLGDNSFVSFYVAPKIVD
jgi:proliferating cell nuclear antigen